MASHARVEFPTADGITLRGLLYPARQRGPAIIMAPGFSFVKEMMLPKVAKYFQQAGITALIFDPRTLGESDGLPRCDMNPVEQVGDYQDAVTFLRRQPQVDADRIALWGFSFNAVVALNAAAVDSRARCVIAVCPLTDLGYPDDQLRTLLADASHDRVERLAGQEPRYVPVVDEHGLCPYGWGSGSNAEDTSMVLVADKVFPTYQNRVTVQFHYRNAMWQPYHMIKMLASTPTMFVSAEKDPMSLIQNQKALLDQVPGPKEQYILRDRGHMNALSGNSFVEAMKAQVDFLFKHTAATGRSKL